MVTVKNISKSFGNIQAVKNLSFSIKPGEIVGLLGPNGAGKTTTMRMIAGFLTADSGEILVKEISVLQNPIEAQKQIGYLPENNPLYKDMLVGELLEFSAELKGLFGKEKKRALDFAIQSTNLQEVFYRPIAELSKGYRQRVGLATCLLHQPPVLIMDEPTEGLDPNQRSEIRALIKKLSQKRTVIISTHVMQEVEALCNRLLIINKGELTADGSPTQLTRLSLPKKQIIFEVEGKAIEKSLKTIPEIENIKVEQQDQDKLLLILTVKKQVKIQPALSQLAAKNNWIIWKLAEEEKQLEEVFHLLTQEKEKP